MDSLEPARKQILRSAAGWYALLCSEEVTEQQRYDHGRWLAADPAHRYAWQQVEQLREQLQSVPGSPALEALRIKQRQGHNRRAVLRGFVLLAGGAALGSVAWQGASPGTWADRLMASHRTGRGERRELILADGTRLLLNTATALDIVQTPTARLIRLYQGEIFIRTGKGLDDSATALQVHTTEGMVLPLGTAFTVRQRDAATEVTVVEDRVELIPVLGNGEARQLAAGERARMSASSVTVSPASVQAHSWTRGLLVVVDWPLERLVGELGRYRPGILRCDPAVAGMQVSGTFPVDDTNRALAAIAHALPVRIHRLTDYWVTVKAQGV